MIYPGPSPQTFFKLIPTERKGMRVQCVPCEEWSIVGEFLCQECLVSDLMLGVW